MMRIQKTKDCTFLVVETDTDGKTFALEECNTYLEACECIEDWKRVDAEWDRAECGDEEEV